MARGDGVEDFLYWFSGYGEAGVEIHEGPGNKVALADAWMGELEVRGIALGVPVEEEVEVDGA